MPSAGRVDGSLDGVDEDEEAAEVEDDDADADTEADMDDADAEADVDDADADDDRCKGSVETAGDD